MAKQHGASRVADAVFAEVENVRRGYSWHVAGKLQEDLAIRDEAFADFLGVSSRTLTRRRKGAGVLDKVASDRLYRIMRVAKLAGSVFEDAARGFEWLRRPQVGLGGATPLSLLDTEPGFEAVESLLERIEYGVIA
ncbi:MAG TPA: antitoxin Xre/MbcA/ParS toxin-binding domain-containing protein [Elusimicrobiota bacterium]|nr:antitoxin Xre/MbcA/ParS toxin-binding domain-containing protein [Elusimicrobiota bacterium]